MELLIAAAVTCDDKSIYVGWIMNMKDENQIIMKGIIQDSLSKIEDLDDENEGDYDNDDDEEEDNDDYIDNDDDLSEDVEYDHEHNDIILDSDYSGHDDDDDDDDNNGNDDDVEGSMSGLFRDAISQFNDAAEGMDIELFDSTTTTTNSDHNTKMNKKSLVSSSSSKKGRTRGGGRLSTSSMDNSNNNSTILRERDELRKALAEAKRELASQQTQSKRMVEDTESSQKKLRALAEDLQERLEVRQAELVEVEDKLLKMKRELEDSEAKVDDLTEKNATLADELDIANAKASQLRKAEATVVAYRKKLEGVGVMNQQMTDLEDQSAKYLGQIMDLEMETKKVPELQKNLEEVKRDLVRAQKERDEANDTLKSKATEISKLKADLSASVKAKKMFEEELLELRSIHQNKSHDSEELDVTDIAMTSAKSLAEAREKAMRLEIENKNLKQQLGIDINTTLGASFGNGSGNVSSATVTALEDEVKSLQATIKKKDALVKKLTTDKDKLEGYTKKTLAKFQEKYLVALQECKARLKEKHEKIEQLEVKSAAEKTNQKREEKLLSSAIYELGLSIMQTKLKQ